MNEDFNWEQLAWTSPIIVAVVTGLFLLLKAVSDKKTNPVDELEKVLKRYQLLLEAEEGRSARAREREKQAFKTALAFRSYATALDRWYQAGCPDPPGKPLPPDAILDVSIPDDDGCPSTGPIVAV